MSRGIDMSRWKDYGHILIDSLWLFPKRGVGGDSSYHGNFVPQLPEQLILRHTLPGDIVIDPFIGSGTTTDVALRLGRKVIGIDIQGDLIDALETRLVEQGYQKNLDFHLICGDSTKRDTWHIVDSCIRTHPNPQVTLAILHPPYHDIVKFSDSFGDLSNMGSVEIFMNKFTTVIWNIESRIANKGVLALVIGDLYARGEVFPLGFRLMDIISRSTIGSFNLKGIIVKDIQGNEKGKGVDSNLWRYRALKGTFSIFKHEYIFVWERNA